MQTPRDRLDQYPHEFSGGMRQRVMIAMALASNPELLIADEPTTALDVTTQAGVIDLLHRLSEERRMAVMLITHDLGIIASFARGRARHVRRRPGRVRAGRRRLRAGRPPVHAGADRGRAAARRTSGPRRCRRSRASCPARMRSRPGCSFAPRCRLAGAREICRSERPAFDMGDLERRVACHFTDESRATAGVLHRQEVSLGEPSIGGDLLAGRRPRQGLPGARRERLAQALAARRRGCLLRHQER